MVLSTSNIENLVVNGTAIDDLDSFHYDCSEGLTIFLNDKNIGNLLNKKNITWGWFQGG
jgi:phospholipase C